MPNFDKSFEISRLLHKQQQGLSLTAEEDKELDEWLDRDKGNRYLFEHAQSPQNLARHLSAYNQTDTEGQLILLQDRLSRQSRVRKIRVLMARVAVVLVSVGLVYWFVSDRTEISTSALVHVKADDIAPGGNNAILTLSNGKTFVLDSTESQLISDGGSVKYADGKDVFSQSDSIYNLSLTTPRKGQYQALLPDGTRVWLNAESKISYPSRFEGDSRVVSVEGEVYFEVAKNQGRRFIVQLEGGRRVEVLGTHFNINAYSNFSDIKTTLLEGSVRVVSVDQTPVILKPHEQAVQKRNSIRVNKVNTDNIIAWKDNKFNFEGLRFEEIMSQIERWYDVEVTYKGEVPNIEFYGEIGRQNTLLYVLKVFENSGIKLQLKGNKLLVY